MAYAAWKDITIQHGRSGPLFRVYDAVTNKLAGDLAGKWTIVDRSTTDVWTSDTSPADGSWLVLQSETPRADGSKLQVFLGFRNATGKLAGFGTKAAGVWSCMSPDGGWDSGAGYFGSALSNWRNSLQTWTTTYTTACTLSALVFTSGDSGRPGSFCCVVRSGTGVNWGVFAGGLVPLSGLSHANSRAVHLFGAARLDNSYFYWGGTGSTVGGLAPTPALDAFDSSNVPGGIGVPPRDRETGAYVEVDVVVYDRVTATSIGALDSLRATNMPDGDISIDGTRHAWGAVSFPREAARDGIWI